MSVDTLIDRYGDPMAPAILTVSPVQVMGLWEQLMQCYYGDNGHGGDVARIYLYTVMPYCPSITAGDQLARDAFLLANRALHDLCALFAQRLDCIVELFDGTPLSALLGPDPEMHSVGIRVRRKIRPA